MKILIMHRTVANHDAIGNDIELMSKVLEKKFDCSVYAENKLNENVKFVSRLQAEEILQMEDSMVLYHHSVYWEYGAEMLKKAKGKIVFRYHNITPEVFFEPYKSVHFKQCQKGREQTRYFISKYPNAYWLSDSLYNTEDLKDVNLENISICAPFHKIWYWMKSKPDEQILKTLIESRKINILFVGRIAPNKGHLFLLEVLRVFLLNYHNNIRLRIVGKYDSGLMLYNDLLRQKVKQYRLDEYIEFIGEVTDASLESYYLGSDLFLCASEHEGFCVPILEAQYFGLPVIALKAAAIPDTGGKGQLILEKDVKAFAAAIKILMENKKYYQCLQNCGKKNVYERFSLDKIQSDFMEQLEKIVGD